MAFESGLDERDLLQSMIPRLAPKSYYRDGWVILTNFIKHQHTDSQTVMQGIRKYLSLAPESVLSYAKEIGYGKGMDTLWIPYNILEPESKHKSNTLDAIASRSVSSSLSGGVLGFRAYDEDKPYEEPSINLDTGLIETHKKQTAKYPNARTVMRMFTNYEKHWNFKTPILQAAERLFSEKGIEKITRALQFYKENKDKEFCPKIYTPIDLEDKWQKLLDLRKRL